MKGGRCVMVILFALCSYRTQN